MAQIVTIALGTVRMDKDGVTPLNRIGDIVAIHDDDVALTGPGYDNFKVIKIAGLTAKEAEDVLNGLRPEVARAMKVPETAKPGEWTFEKVEEAEFWKDGDDWKKIEKSPKYTLNLSNLDDTDLASLIDVEAPPSMKRTIIEAKGEHNYAVSSMNLTAVVELTGLAPVK